MSGAVAVELAIDRPGECPVAAASAAADASAESVQRSVLPDGEGRVVEQFSLPAGTGPVPATGDAVPAVDGGPGPTSDGAAGRSTDVDAGPPTEREGDASNDPVVPSERGERLDPVARTGDDAVYRFSRDAGRPCVCDLIERHTGPVSEIRARDGTLLVSFFAADVVGVRDVVAVLGERFEGVRVRRLVRSGADEGDRSDPVVLDRGRLTARQREVLSVAHELGYFDHPKGANAEEVAAELDIASATLREHLAAAQGKLLDAVVES